jgi:hypothetical protein
MPRPQSVVEGHHRVRPVVLLALDSELRARFAFELVACGFDVALIENTVSPTRLADRGPDIIVTALSTEEGNQWSPLMLRRDRRFRGVPVVGIAADTSVATRSRAQREGCAAVCLITCSANVLAVGLRALLDTTDSHEPAGSTVHG